MSGRSDPQGDFESLRDKIIGLGERSIRKSYYPELQEKLTELERFRTLLDQSNDLIFLMRVPSAELIDVNESACVQLGYARADLLSRSLFDIVDRSTYDKLKKAFEYQRTEIFPGQTFNILLLKKNKANIPVEIAIRLVEFGNDIYSVAAARDISERVRAEAALQESEEKYRTLFEESRDVIFISTSEGRFLDINMAGVELFGYSSKDELLSIDIEKDLFVEPKERSGYQLILHSKGFVKDHEVEMKKKSGEKLNVLVTASAVETPAGTIYRGIIRDITVHKKLEQQLLQSQKMEAVGQLAGGVAHDFNNILTAIIGYSNLIQMKTQENFTREYISQILALSDRAAHLTQSLLAFSRNQAINPKPADVNVIVNETVKFLKRLIGEDIELKTFLAGEKLMVFADSGQIEQVLMNLATNARDAMPNGGTLCISTSQIEPDKQFAELHGFGNAGRFAMITVTDDGIGMDEKTVARIFEPFFTTKEVGKGTGLGLAMVYGIIKQHNGFINVYSEPDKGTVFRIYLPAIESGTENGEKAEREFVRGGAETILLAEDEAEVRKITKAILEEFGYRVIEAANGEEAERKFIEHQNEIKMLVTDVIMPGKSGKEVYRNVHSIKPSIKVLFTSGYTIEITQKHGLLEEGLELISKPVAPKELLRKIREILDADVR